MTSISRDRFDRRHALGLGAAVGAFALAASSFESSAASAASGSSVDASFKATAARIEQIIQAQGSASNGVFTIGIDRDDVEGAMLRGVAVTPPFQLDGALVFQPQSDGQVLMNGDFPLKNSEVDPFIDALLNAGIVFQAEHQHFYDLRPTLWFIHFRAFGDPLAIARGIKRALNTTSTPFPQTMPPNPTTSLPAKRIGAILGAKPTIGAKGTITVDLPRKEPLVLGGMKINPYLNVQTSIVFQPIEGGNAAAAPDFGMIASEVQPLMTTMRRLGWDVGCLYNQEIDEQPQLYFSHQFKTGDPIILAHEIRQGLDQTNVMFM